MKNIRIQKWKIMKNIRIQKYGLHFFFINKNLGKYFSFDFVIKVLAFSVTLIFSSSSERTMSSVWDFSLSVQNRHIHTHLTDLHNLFLSNKHKEITSTIQFSSSFTVSIWLANWTILMDLFRVVHVYFNQIDILNYF